jgi:hypothetical protein
MPTKKTSLSLNMGRFVGALIFTFSAAKLAGSTWAQAFAADLAVLALFTIVAFILG